MRSETERSVLKEVRERLLATLDDNGGEPFIRIEVSGNKGMEDVIQLLTDKLCGAGAIVHRETFQQARALGEYPLAGFRFFISAPTLVRDEQKEQWLKRWNQQHEQWHSEKKAGA